MPTTAAAVLAYASMGSAWFVKMIVSALIHGVIYGLVFKLFRSLSFPEACALGIVMLACCFMVARRR